jgi:anthranilate synthase/aminodeoxychorismate synthase-like glutamine amidotransferase
MSKPRLVIIDNYDSFTWNLVQAFAELGAEVLVHANDRIDLPGVWALQPTHICISPGPGHPAEAGISLALIRAALGRLPLLGVCLGHQGLAAALGGAVVRAPRLRHGKASPILHDGQGLYAGLPQGFEAGRYHSLIVDTTRLPESLIATSWTPEGELMGLRHRSGLAEGVQFHPESVLSPLGPRLLQRFLRWRAPSPKLESPAP